MEESRSVNYPELLNFFYDANFPCKLKGNSVAVAHAIMQKWNRLLRPVEFEMSNQELSFTSGVTTHIERARQEIVEHVKVEGSPLFIYISQGQKRAGIYKINTTLIPKKVPNSSQKEAVFGNDPKGSKSKENKDPVNKGPSSKYKADGESEFRESRGDPEFDKYGFPDNVRLWSDRVITPIHDIVCIGISEHDKLLLQLYQLNNDDLVQGTVKAAKSENIDFREALEWVVHRLGRQAQ